MSETINFLLKNLIIQSIIFSQFVEYYVIALSLKDKRSPFEICEQYNNPFKYGDVICGTDGETYPNAVYLACFNHQTSQDVATKYDGKCRDGVRNCRENFVYSPVCGTNNRTWSNYESLFCHNYMHSTNFQIYDKGECEKTNYCKDDGIKRYGINPVCASNGLTYQNVAQVKCQQTYVYNNMITIMHNGGCTTEFVYNLYGLGPEVCSIAKLRSEWNPLCAAGNTTFQNPFIYLCFAADHLPFSYDDECGAIFHDACKLTQTKKIRVNGKDFNAKFTQDDEVCGSDGRTYESVHHIQCESNRDKYLYEMHKGRCAGPNDNPCGMVPEEDQRFPVCGTDGITYISPEALWCMKRRYPEKKLSYFHDGTCFSRVNMRTG